MDARNERDLVLALDRVVDVVQNHLYHAYLEVRDFYETTLLSPAIPLKEKAEMALDIAGRWEQIDQSSSALSTYTTHSELSTNELSNALRSRSLSQITRPTASTSEDGMKSNPKNHTSSMTNSFGRLDLNRGQHRHHRHQHKASSTSNHRLSKTQKSPIFDDDGSSRSPSFASASVSNASSPRRRQGSEVSSTFRVQLTRGPQGFGFSIAGGIDQEPPLPNIDPRFVYVARITSGGVADTDGRLKINDILLSVNGFGLVGLPHLKAVTVFEQSGSYLDLEVQRPIHTLSVGPTQPPIQSRTSSQISSTTGSLNNESQRLHSHGSSVSQSGAVRSRITTLSRSHCMILPATSASPSPSPSGGTTESSGAQPTTVSPLSSLFTSCQYPSNPPEASKKSPVLEETLGVGKESRNRKDNEDDEDTVWLYDPEQTAGGRSLLQNATDNNISSRELNVDTVSGGFNIAVNDTVSPRSSQSKSNKMSYQLKKQPSPATPSTEEWELLTRPQPDPSPGPIIVEIPLVRGTSSGFGFSIAGGVGSEFLEGDSGIFITQVTPGGVADTCGRIGIGDRLLRVNKVSLVDVTHTEAVEALQRAGDFALLLLVKASVQSSPQRINCKQCQETIRNLHSFSNASMSNDGKSWEGKQLRESAEDYADSRHSRHRSSGKRRIMTQPKIPVVLGPPKHAAEALPLSSSSHGSEDYAAARAVPDSVLRRWPRARLVTLYKEDPAMQRSNGSKSGERTGGSLGFNILGGDGTDGIYVSHIHPDRPAARSKAISVGDRLLVVNGVEVVGSSHEEAAILLKTASYRVDLVLAYCPAEYKKLEEQVRAQTEGQSDNGEDEQGERCKTEAIGPHTRHSIEADGLFVRVLADFDPHEVMEINQVIPRDAISIRSGDILQLLNVSDREWWQARIIYPSTCKPLGPTGLVPSRRRLERQELAKWTLRFGREPLQPPRSFSHRASSSDTPPSVISDLQSTDKAIESIPLSQSDAPSTPSKQSSLHDATSIDSRWHKLSIDSRKSTTRRARSEFAGETMPPTYIPVTSIQAVNTRPVVIMGDLKHNITEDLLTEFPDNFGSCVPHTTRHRRHGEVDGRDYHFVKSRTRMESEIQMNRYIEAGEYNGNLYGTHIHSVFKIASTGQHCLLDVGVPALQRLDAAGLPPITIFVLSDLPDQSLRVVDPSGTTTKQEEINPYRRLKRLEKNFAFLKENAPLMTAVLFVDEYNKCMERIQKIINDNKGPNVWTASNDFLP
ncbi:unnamed protein product [Hymenolepis diminuta]|uniref:Uncharacterized protein n=3 Tax=Hymenolepis diminuta TaxID=6216 RepID=A0A3P7BID8_HYMDI|nr:unnamed protein product [Hymenolepis diminuta]